MLRPPLVAARRPLAQIPDDKEIGIEAHPVNDAQFMVQARPQLLVVLGAVLAITSDQARFAQMAQISCRRVLLGNLKVGQMVPFRIEVDLTHLGDEQRVVKRAGNLAE